MDLLEPGHDHGAFGQGVADSAAERVHEVFLGMAVGREVEPFAAAALLAIVAKRVLQPDAPRVKDQVVVLQQQLDRVEPVQDYVTAASGR